MKIKNKVSVFIVLGFLFCLSIFYANSVQAMTIDEIKQQMKIVKTQIDELQTRYSSLQQQLSQLLNTCTDTDNGRDYFTKGVVSYNEQSFTDLCLGDNVLNEYVCENSKQKAHLYTCPNGCSDGACKKADTASCHKTHLWSWNYCSPNCQCEAGQGDCDTDADCKTGYCATDVGRNYGQHHLMDVCEEKTAITCVDSDNGDDYYTKGTVSYNNKTYIDHCYNKDKVYEYKCVDNKARSHAYLCPNGCENGVCVKKQESISCSDSDNGKDYFTKGVVTYNGLEYKDLCLGGNKLSETICNNNGVVDTVYYTCSKRCQDGACVNTDLSDLTINRFTISQMSSQAQAEMSYCVINAGTKESEQAFVRFSNMSKITHPIIGPKSLIAIKKLASNEMYCDSIIVDASANDSLTVGFQNGLNKIQMEIISNDNSENNSNNTSIFNFNVVSSQGNACQDSDGGKDYLTKGYVTLNGKTYNDYCTQDVYINEQYCDDNGGVSVAHGRCTYGCVNGACNASSPTGLKNAENELANIASATAKLSELIKKMLSK